MSRGEPAGGIYVGLRRQRDRSLTSQRFRDEVNFIEVRFTSCSQKAIWVETVTLSPTRITRGDNGICRKLWQ